MQLTINYYCYYYKYCSIHIFSSNEVFKTFFAQNWPLSSCKFLDFSHKGSKRRIIYDFHKTFQANLSKTEWNSYELCKKNQSNSTKLANHLPCVEQHLFVYYQSEFFKFDHLFINLHIITLSRVALGTSWLNYTVCLQIFKHDRIFYDQMFWEFCINI